MRPTKDNVWPRVECDIGEIHKELQKRQTVAVLVEQLGILISHVGALGGGPPKGHFIQQHRLPEIRACDGNHRGVRDEFLNFRTLESGLLIKVISACLRCSSGVDPARAIESPCLTGSYLGERANVRDEVAIDDLVEYVEAILADSS